MSSRTTGTCGNRPTPTMTLGCAGRGSHGGAIGDGGRGVAPLNRVGVAIGAGAARGRRISLAPPKGRRGRSSVRGLRPPDARREAARRCARARFHL